MKEENPKETTSSSGLTGTLKILGVFAILMMAGLAMLLVLDLIPRYLFNDLAIKTSMVIGIWAVAAGLVTLLSRLR